MNSHAGLSAAQQLASSGGGGSATTLEKSGAGGKGDEDDMPELEPAEEDDGPVDETGLDAKDIELVIQQVGCSRAKAVKALKQNNGDLINASACSMPYCPSPINILLSVMAASG
jgi:nascent polypeptide-associated complex subunit alpha